MQPLRVFLSGTRRDLAAYWPAAAEAIRTMDGFEPILMDEGVASPLPTDAWSRREASTCDLYLALIGRCYGRVPSGQSVSITEQEYDTAGLAEIDRLVFLTENSDPAIVADEDVDKHEAVQRFRVKVAEDVVYARVGDPTDFGERVIAALRDWERRTFRGLTTTADAYYRPWLEETPDFGHQDELVGRSAELDQLTAFATSAKRVLLIHSPWGQGKSRLLLELSRHVGKRARFIRESAAITRQALDFSAADPSVIILDDAQHRSSSERRTLLASVRPYSREVKIVLGSRRASANEVVEEVRQLGYPVEDLTVVALEPLPDSEHQQLISKILGRESPEGYIISRRTKGSVLAGVVAARLYRRGALTLGQVESGQEFRQTVLRAYEAAIRERPRGIFDKDLQDLLRVVAMAGPLSVASDQTVEAIAAFLQWPSHSVRSNLAILVDSGLLIQRGQKVRVPVDAAAEELRRNACVDACGVSLGYAEAALSNLWPATGNSLVENLAALTFELRRDGISVEFLRDFWPQLTISYAAAPASERLAILPSLERLAPYAPVEMLAFVGQAVASGLGPEEPDERMRGRVKTDWLEDHLAALLQGVCVHPEHVAAACDLLWSMAEHDQRDPSRHVSSAERILREVASYDRHGGEGGTGEALLRWVERHRRGSGMIPGHRLAHYLRPLLARESERSWFDGAKFFVESGALPAERLTKMRQRALGLLEEIALAGSLTDASAAIAVIGEAVSKLMGSFGRQVSQAEAEQWRAEEVDALARLQRVRDRHKSRALDLAVLQRVRWAARYSKNARLREQAGEMAESIHAHLAGSLELAVVHDYDLLRHSDDPAFTEHEVAVRGIAEASTGTEIPALVARVEEAIAGLQASGFKPDPTLFFSYVARLNPKRGEDLIRQILSEPEKRLIGSVPGTLLGLGLADPGRAAALAAEFVASSEVGLLQVMPHAFRYQDFVAALGPDLAVVHLKRLLAHEDGQVQAGALHAIGFNNSLPHEARLELLLDCNLAAHPENGSAWVNAFHSSKGADQCSDEQLLVGIQQLCTASTLGLFAGDVISRMAARLPDPTIEMLVSRVARAGTPSFETEFGSSDGGPLAALSTTAREAGMIALGQYLGARRFEVSHAASQLFHLLAAGSGDSMRRVRLAWARSGDPVQMRQAAESVRWEESEFVLAEEKLIVELLEAAEAYSPELLQEVEAMLHAPAGQGIRSGTPGQPFERDVQLRDGAQTIAAKQPPGSAAQRFYSQVAAETQSVLDYHAQRYDEDNI